MADEWIPVELNGPNNDGRPKRRVIAVGAEVSIGAVLQLLDPRTVSNSHLAKVACGGVAAEEHVAGTRVNSIQVWTDAVFEAVASGAITLGAPVMLSLLDNRVQAITSPDVASSSLINTILSPAFIPAYALETASAGEKINVRYKI